MALETKLNLRDETVSKLQELLRINVDSEKGLREAADDVQDPTVRNTFLKVADERGAQASELAGLLEINSEDASTEGSYAAAFHRSWMKVREAISGNDTYVVLAEAERGEDVIKESYESALKETGGSAANDVLTRHYAAVKAAHDHIRDMRDARKKS